VSAFYCIRAISAFRKRRNQFKEFLSSNSNNITPNRYFRLMCLAAIEVVCTIPLTSWMVYLNAKVVNPWISWASVHSDFGHIDQVPRLFWKEDPALIELARWNPIICAMVFFAFFGFADEAKKHYYLAYVSVAKKLGYTSVGSSSGFGSSNGKQMSHAASLPVFVKRDISSKIDTFGSFADDISVADLEGAMNDAKFSPDSSMSSRSSVSDLNAAAAATPAAPAPVAPKQAKVKPMPPVMAMMDHLDMSALDRIPSHA